jgi:DNA-directed RNA polymerase specialized sigma24 family protein
LQARDTGALPLTELEVKRAIAVLAPAGWLRLHKAARALCRNAHFDAEDLLQEAFERALEGSRQCSRTLDIVLFLVGVMRSIASDWRKARRRRPEMSLVSPTGSLQEVAIKVRDERLGPDEWLASAQEANCLRQTIFALFADDGVAQRMLEGIMDGIAGEELRSLTQLNQTQFESKRRLIRRRIDKAFPQERKP